MPLAEENHKLDKQTPSSVSIDMERMHSIQHFKIISRGTNEDSNNRITIT